MNTVLVSLILDKDTVIAEHTSKINDIMNKYVDDLSISEMAFIKGVSAGSITTMKKNGASNEKILRTKANSQLSDKDKAMLFLKSMSDDERAAFLATL